MKRQGGLFARALWELGEPHGIPVLEAEGSRPKPFVRQAAAEALREIRAVQEKK